MVNLLILYNPYYQSDVIERHLAILKDKGKVAFGKVKSKLKDRENKHTTQLEQIYNNVSVQKPLQLFLTDYANLFVAKVICVHKVDSMDSSKALELESLLPAYYKEKKYQVEYLFEIVDLRELVREDFSTLRDKYLANFITPHYANDKCPEGLSYAIYGGNYDFPLLIKQKEEKCYFDGDTRHYLNVFHSKAYLAVQKNLVSYVFGETILNLLHPDSIAHIISAELEFQDNATNKLYDFTSIVVKYSKILEYEIYAFICALLEVILKQNPNLESIGYSVQEREYTLKDFATNKPNLGTMRHLLVKDEIKSILDSIFPKMRYFMEKELPNCIKKLQPIRNQSVHGKPATLDGAREIRNLIIGIESFSILKSIVLHKKSLKS